MKSIRDQLINSKKVLITTHKSPDGDAIGSSVFLYHVLLSMGKTPTILLPDSPPAILDYFLIDLNYLVYENQPSDVDMILDSFDTAIHLDYNAENRVGQEMSLIFKRIHGTQIMIDHHPNPSMQCEINISRPDYSSTCELLYDVLEKSDLSNYINSLAASACYLGIMTDTGSFRFSSVTSNTHRVIHLLMQQNIEHYRIHELIYDSNSINQIKLKGYALSNKLEILEHLNLGMIALTKNELSQFNYQKGDTEGLVNAILSIKGINIAVFLIEKSEEIKISFRSKGSRYVNDFAKKFFEGGGHNYAAGGVSRVSMEETINQLKKYAEVYFV